MPPWPRFHGRPLAPGSSRPLAAGVVLVLFVVGLRLWADRGGVQPASAADKPCTAVAKQRALPAELVLGGTVEVTLDLTLTCDAAPAPVDVVLVVDRSASMAGPNLADAVSAVDAFLAVVDFRRTRVALVSFAAEATRDARLTTDPDLVRSAARRLVADGNTFISVGLREAARAFESAPPVVGALPVIVLLTDGHDSLGADAVRSQAALQRDSGRYLVTIALGLSSDRALLAEIASSPADAWFAPRSSDLAKIYARISSGLMAVTPATLTLLDELPTDMLVEAGTIRPLAQLRGRSLVWQVPALPGGEFHAVFRVRPSQLGSRPVSLGATAHYTDTRGLAGAVQFPIPTVMVLLELPTPRPSDTPSPTPTPFHTPRPSATLTATTTVTTPVRPEATATRTPGPGGPGWYPLYLPLTVNRWCVKAPTAEQAESCR
jgi:Mg-chelatase subunit ChlD